MHVYRKDATQCPQSHIYLHGMTLKRVKSRAFGKYRTSQLTDDINIQLKHGQLNGPVHTLC